MVPVAYSSRSCCIILFQHLLHVIADLIIYPGCSLQCWNLEVILVITSAVKDICGKAPTGYIFLDKSRRMCPFLDEIVWKVRGCIDLNYVKANFDYQKSNL